MTEARRVLLVSPFGFLGGAERGLVAVAGRLPDLGWQPSAALMEDGPLREALEAVGCPVTVVPSGRIRQVTTGVRTVAALRRAIRSSHADVVLSNLSTAHLYAGLAARLSGVPAVHWQQIIPLRDYGGPKMSHAGVERLAARVPSDAVVALSDEAMAAQRDLSERAVLRKVWAGVDLDAVRAASGAGPGLRRRRGWGDGPVVGIVGWLERWKGQDVFLRAAAQLADASPTARFVVVGGPGDAGFAEELPELAAALGLEDRVTFAGHQPDPYPWFDACDVVVHASFGEAFGLVLVEAMALGKPVVATDRGGPQEVVVPGTTGWLVPPGDPAALAAAVAPLLEDPALRERTGAAARERAERFGHAAMAAGMAAVLDEVVAARAAGGRLA